MEIVINGVSEVIEKGSTVLDLLHSIGEGESSGKAIAVNNEVVPRSVWKNTLLKEGDKILLITATQGG